MLLGRQLASSLLSLLIAVLFVVGTSCGQEKSIDEFVEFMKTEILKDERQRVELQKRGEGLDLESQLASARKVGLDTALVLIEKLGKADAEAFPGIHRLIADLQKPGAIPDPAIEVEDWAEFDSDSLTLNNPNFWVAYYEVAPGQGVMEALYGSLLRAEGECTRSLQVSVIARMGRRTNGSLTSFHVANAMGNQIVYSAASFRIGQVIELFEKQEYENAAAGFREILDVWPQCGLASFELGLTLHHQKEHKAGRRVQTQVLPPNDPRLPTQETYDLYRTARQHDPMIRNAYQGGSEVAGNMIAMAKVVLPAYRSISDFSNRKIDGNLLALFGGGCEEIGLHDYALFTRQVFISLNNKFEPADLVFIQNNLESLIDKDTVGKIVASLSRKEVVQFSFQIEE